MVDSCGNFCGVLREYYAGALAETDYAAPGRLGRRRRVALEELTQMFYEELHRLAHRYMGGERAGHNLQTTALINDSYLPLIDWKNGRWQHRACSFAVSTQLMRCIIVDVARARGYQKRGGGVRAVFD